LLGGLGAGAGGGAGLRVMVTSKVSPPELVTL